MATAPTPGAQQRKQASTQRFRIVIDDIEAVIYPAVYGPRDDVIVRMATKKPAPAGWGMELSLTGLVSQLGDGATIGTDTLCTLWWFGRYKAGENVTLGDLIEAFPPLAEVDERVTVEVVTDDDEDNSPEA